VNRHLATGGQRLAAIRYFELSCWMVDEEKWGSILIEDCLTVLQLRARTHKNFPELRP